MSDTEVGATVSDVSVGFTKKPRHPVARANVKSGANAAKSRSFRMKPGILKESRQTHLVGIVRKWRKGIVAEEGFSQNAQVYFRVHESSNLSRGYLFVSGLFGGADRTNPWKRPRAGQRDPLLESSHIMAVKKFFVSLPTRGLLLIFLSPAAVCQGQYKHDPLKQDLRTQAEVGKAQAPTHAAHSFGARNGAALGCVGACAFPTSA